jgi:tripartite-type tricarboxylate transporter receptor subunit TctC
MMLSPRALAGALALTCALSLPVATSAQDYPAHPVKIVVPFGAGGPADVYSRVLAQYLSEALKQPFVVEDRPGAGSIIGTDAVAKSPPDGYTLMLVSSSVMSHVPAVYAKLRYDMVRDFAPVGKVSEVPLVVVFHPSVPVKTTRQFIALAKSRPGDLRMAIGGTGTTSHLVTELVGYATGIRVLIVPYKGAGPALVDLLGGHVDGRIDQIPSSMSHIQSNRLRAIAVTTTRRAELLPELPTLAESGVPGFDASTMIGVFVPAGTPPEIVQRLNAALNNMTFTPTPGYTGAASIQMVSNDLGKTGTGGPQTDDDTINITVTASLAMYINELLFNPPGADAPNEYIEIRGPANTTIPVGTYLVAIEGDAADNPGDVQTIINLSGLSFGSNGFLVLLQNGNTYTTDAGATVLTSTTAGFGGLPGAIFQADGGATDIEDASVTFMLIQTGAAPSLTDDIDVNDDGTTDGFVFAGWNVRDSISVVNGSANARAYGAISFAAGSGTGISGEILVGFVPSYVGRIGDSTGSTSADWVASGVLGGPAPNWTLGTAGETAPASFANKALNHIGASNFANLAPVNSVPAATQNVNEDFTLTFNAGNANLISISDPDAARTVERGGAADHGSPGIGERTDVTRVIGRVRSLTVDHVVAEVRGLRPGVVAARVVDRCGVKQRLRGHARPERAGPTEEGAVDDRHRRVTRTPVIGGGQPGGAGADDDDVESVHQLNGFTTMSMMNSTTRIASTQNTGVVAWLIAARSSGDGASSGLSWAAEPTRIMRGTVTSDGVAKAMRVRT